MEAIRRKDCDPAAKLRGSVKTRIPTLAEAIANAEANHICYVLTLCDRKKDAARILGISVSTLREKRQALGLPMEDRGARRTPKRTTPNA